MKTKRMILILLVSMLLLSLGCGLLGGDEEDPAEAAESVEEGDAAEAPTVAEPTEEPPTMAPPTEELPTVEPPTVEPTSAPSWRIPPPEGSLLVVQDTDNNPQWEEIAAMHAANLAIPAPYFYEVYVLPQGIRFPEVEAHYTNEMGIRKYNIARNQQGTNQELYLMTYLYSLNKSSKNAVLFFGELSNRDPLALVIYSNPIE